MKSKMKKRMKKLRKKKNFKNRLLYRMRNMKVDSSTVHGFDAEEMNSVISDTQNMVLGVLLFIISCLLVGNYFLGRF